MTDDEVWTALCERAGNPQLFTEITWNALQPGQGFSDLIDGLTLSALVCTASLLEVYSSLAPSDNAPSLYAGEVSKGIKAFAVGVMRDKMTTQDLSN